MASLWSAVTAGTDCPTIHERSLRADHGQPDAVVFAELDDSLVVGYAERWSLHAGFAGDAGVPRGTAREQTARTL